MGLITGQCLSSNLNCSIASAALIPKTLNMIIQFFIAFVLFIRFNPFQKRITCNRNDRIFILASCFFLLVNDEFTDYMRTFFRDRIDRLKTFF